MRKCMPQFHRGAIFEQLIGGGIMQSARVFHFSAVLLILVVFSFASTGGAALAQDAAIPDTDDATPVTSVPDYKINPGDQLAISVWREDQLQRAVMVLPDGTISFPLVGTFKAAGKTPKEVEDLISAGLEENFVGGEVPDVTVAVSSTSGLQFSVIGKVRAPGIFNPGRYVTVLEALSFAGGVTEFASLSNVVVVRKTSDGLVVLPARLSGVLRSRSIDTEDVVALPTIRSGDTIIVP